MPCFGISADTTWAGHHPCLLVGQGKHLPAISSAESFDDLIESIMVLNDVVVAFGGLRL
jgi:hypothetical protein